MPAKTQDELVSELIIGAADCVLKWLAWKSSHDYKSAMMSCCERSAKLFDAMEHLQVTLLEAGVIIQEVIDESIKEK